MSKNKIALFANHGSPQLEAIKDAVIAEGGEPVCFDIQLGGKRQSRFSLGRKSMKWDGIDFSDIKAIYIRCTAPNTWPALPPVLNSASYNDLRTKYLRELDYHACTTSFFERLASKGKLVINTLSNAYLDHDSKSQLYEKLRVAGFDTPITLTTTDCQEAVSFIEHHGAAVVKPMIGVGSTRIVFSNDNERMDDVIFCPTMFQERITGKTIRVHIVGDKVVLALKILAGDNIDSRTDTKGFEFFEMPLEQQKKIVAANRFLGLHFAAWDIIVTEDGRYVYLDCNPGGFIMWIGSHYVNGVMRQMARYMLTFSDTLSVEAASAKVDYVQKSAGDTSCIFQ
jgi:glutathione synthase/RimK-type ligase-like ATP-grasp enzyme